MCFAWYGHLKFKDRAVWLVILASWGIAFFEYCFQVPANRLGHTTLTAPQLKVVQEAVTFSVFAVFSIFYLRERPTIYDHAAFALVVLAVTISLMQPQGGSEHGEDRSQLQFGSDHPAPQTLTSPESSD
jgi:uncharacterized protein (DUF486 family)